MIAARADLSKIILRQLFRCADSRQIDRLICMPAMNNLWSVALLVADSCLTLSPVCRTRPSPFRTQIWRPVTPRKDIAKPHEILDVIARGVVGKRCTGFLGDVRMPLAVARSLSMAEMTASSSPSSSFSPLCDFTQRRQTTQVRLRICLRSCRKAQSTHACFTRCAGAACGWGQWSLVDMVEG